MAAPTILLVEDDQLLREALRMLLEDAGYRVLEAETAAQALDRSSDERPALVVLDLGLPDRPGLEVAFNHDTWRDRPIVPHWDQDLEPELQYNRYTSDTAKILGENLKLSPAKIDHLIRGHFGTLGEQSVWALDVGAVRPLSGAAEKPPPPARQGVSEIPGLRRWFSCDLSPGSAESLAQFYRLRDRLRTVKRSAERYEGQQREDYLLRHREVLAMDEQIRAAERRINIARDRMHQVFDDPDMDPQQKREELSRLTAQMIDIAREVLAKDPYSIPD
jgi:hypothetical protein